MTEIDWPGALDELERETIIDEADDDWRGSLPPFAPSDRVYDIKHPQAGSMRVERCEPYPDGLGWYVVGKSGICTVTAPADRYRLWPAGLSEPPQPPSPGDLYDLGPAGWNSGWAADMAWADPEFRARFDAWRREFDEWVRFFNQATEG